MNCWKSGVQTTSGSVLQDICILFLVQWGSIGELLVGALHDLSFKRSFWLLCTDCILESYREARGKQEGHLVARKVIQEREEYGLIQRGSRGAWSRGAWPRGDVVDRWRHRQVGNMLIDWVHSPGQGGIKADSQLSAWTPGLISASLTETRKTEWLKTGWAGRGCNQQFCLGWDDYEFMKAELSSGQLDVSVWA